MHCVVWNDGEKWQAAVDTSDMYEEEASKGKLADATALADFQAERQYGTFSAEDACNFGVHIYDEGNVLSIVVESGENQLKMCPALSSLHDEEMFLNLRPLKWITRRELS